MLEEPSVAYAQAIRRFARARISRSRSSSRAASSSVVASLRNARAAPIIAFARPTAECTISRSCSWIVVPNRILLWVADFVNVAMASLAMPSGAPAIDHEILSAPVSGKSHPAGWAQAQENRGYVRPVRRRHSPRNRYCRCREARRHARCHELSLARARSSGPKGTTASVPHATFAGEKRPPVWEQFISIALPLLAPFGPPAMSSLRSLSGTERLAVSRFANHPLIYFRM